MDRKPTPPKGKDDETERYATGNEGFLLIHGREFQATYVALKDDRTRAAGSRPKPESRIGTTYAALGNGPKTGEQLYLTGNWMPREQRRMDKNQFRAHLRWLVQQHRLHVIRGEGQTSATPDTGRPASRRTARTTGWQSHEPLPRVMRAVVLTGHGGLDRLCYRGDWPVPGPGGDRLLIRVRACGLNNTDINTRVAWYASRTPDVDTASASVGFDDASWSGRAITFPRIQGADVCGTVAGVTGEADPSLLGQRVLIDPWLRDWREPHNLDRCGYFGSECDGGFAEYTAVPARNVHVIDSDRSHAELASFPTAWVTAENMLNRARVDAGDRVLITGASGGVGSALVQLAGRRGAATVALCADDKAAAIQAAGADFVLSRTPPDLRTALESATGWGDVTVVADVVGGPLWPQLLPILQRGGRYVCAGAIAGAVVRFDLRAFYLRDITLVGATVVPPGVFADLVGYIERHEVEPMLAATYPLQELVAAQQAFLAKCSAGNIVVDMDAASC